jgi:error-prone DNA polymerase
MPIAYAELHTHSCYSLLDGVATPAALVARAAWLELPALALTDHDAVYGVVPFVTAARAHGIRPILGAELTFTTGHHLTLLVANACGWAHLCTLISRARANAPKGQAALAWRDLPGHTEGLICLSGCRRGPVAAALRRMDTAGAARAATWLRDQFGPARCWIELQHHLLPGDGTLVRALAELARYIGVGCVVTNNVHYVHRAGHELRQVLQAIRQGTKLTPATLRRRISSEAYLKRGAQFLPFLADYSTALANTLRIAEQCAFELHYGVQDLPPFPTPHGYDAISYLRERCLAALPVRYPGERERAARQLAHELRIIAQANLANYFLIVWDIVREARQRGIRCQGRGSAANSLVAYLLGISPIDPLQYDLVFERFLSPERRAPPDIDLDLAGDRREEIIQYVYRTYGPAHVAMACTFVTFGERSARRDSAHVLDLPPAAHCDSDPAPDSPQALAAALGRELCGLPRHLGQHNGGMVLTAAPLAERVATEPAAMPGRVVVQWDKEALEAVGLVKIDLLGLRMLAVLSEAEQVLADAGTPVDLDRLTFDDPAVYAMMAAADTIGVFQVESRAQAQVLPRLMPTCFADLIVAISLIRPGPIQGEMVHPYLRRRMGVEPVTYPHPRLRPALEETLGVILFQEQVIKVARDLAGFTPGQGEQLRRALGSGRGPAAIAPWRDAFHAGAAARGVPPAVAEGVFRQLAAFGSYAFPKSHAAAFAVIVYQSAWLKRYHPAALLVGLLNQQPMGCWPPSILVRDAQRHGVSVLPLDLAASDARCTLEEGAVRLGFTTVRGLGADGAQRIVAARRARPFSDLADLCRRTRLPRRLVAALIQAGACDGWGLARRTLLWQLGTLRSAEDELDLPIPGSAVELPDDSAAEAQAAQGRVLGVACGAHPLARWRAALTAQGYRSSAQLAATPAGQAVVVIGTIAMAQQPPTAKGFAFLTLEDEEGMIQVILRPAIAAACRAPRSHTGLLEVHGIVQREAGIVHVRATRLIPRAVE